MRHIACEGRCFVLSACQFLAGERHQPGASQTPLIRGGSGIVAPLGDWLAGPAYGSEQILTAEIDLAEIAEGKFDLDVVGHYARADVFQLQVNESPQEAVSRLPPAGRLALAGSRMIGSTGICLGLLIWAAVLWDGFATIVLPRTVTPSRRLSGRFNRLSWWIWSGVARRIGSVRPAFEFSRRLWTDLGHAAARPVGRADDRRLCADLSRAGAKLPGIGRHRPISARCST